MSRIPSTTRALLVAAFAAGALFGLAGTASATPSTEPESGDDRATAHEGNVVAKDCDDLFPGSEAVDESFLTVDIDESNTYIDITAVAEGFEVTGVIVKGGPAYNVYAPDGLGELPWEDLHSPLVPSGKPAQISHWFACGTGAPTTSTAVPTETETEEPTTSPTSEAPSSSEAAAPVATTPAQDVENAAAEEPLAETGVDAGWTVALGAALLLGGGALLLLMRMRGARR